MLATAPVVTLADLLPRTRVRTTALVVAAAALTALAAQISVPVPGTPVPVTLQTFAVLLTGAALGARRGAAAQALYVAVGVLGMPVYADGQGGWEAATGATAGYLVGFIVAAAVVGTLAERQQDRTVLTALPAMLFGSAVIYSFGVAWLTVHLGVSAARAVELGLTPFVIGDVAKLVVAGLALPAAWALVERTRD
ncbi:MAG TPA: biotin transporter BioY [Acidimicrobiales bacterium]|nr:biotin transporter BioY [Acidimicrobiales bacterium]